MTKKDVIWTALNVVDAKVMELESEIRAKFYELEEPINQIDSIRGLIEDTINIVLDKKDNNIKTLFVDKKGGVQ